ncbi:MAG TPA: homoserine dehydrogenase [Dehalococcoidia bacterium]|nr:homoserine dehydrogenase [Dehalococcoidia bacterium]
MAKPRDRQRIQIGLLGLGVVGSGVAKALAAKAALYERQLGAGLHLRRVLVKNPSRERSVLLEEGAITSNAADVLGDDAIGIVIEVMGGETPAYEYICQALSAGKHVVTANKEVMAKHGPELLELADANGVELLFEASVGGGIPIISPLKRDLSANQITNLRAIINGTTNYILTRMDKEGIDFDEALRQAQALGYAESDPTNDIEAHDAVYKLAILASLAFHTTVRPRDIYREGITRINARDFRYARELGFAIKLLAVARRDGEAVQVHVHPALVAQDELLAKVDGVLNAVEVEGDLLGRVLFQGPGAGANPTTSAVLADVLDAARAIVTGRPPHGPAFSEALRLKPMSEVVARYYIRMVVADSPGVLSVIARCFGDNAVSIASVIQKETDEAAQSAEIVIMTHPAREAAMQSTITALEDLDVVVEIGNFLRVEG